MHQFTAKEFELLRDDLLLYCGDGNIREIIDTYGPTPHGGSCGGLIRANMDEFKFTMAAFHDQKDYWAIDLPSPMHCITLGHPRIQTLCFPKIHLDPALAESYRIANILNYCYNYFSGVTNDQRRRDLEEQLAMPTCRLRGRWLAISKEIFVLMNHLIRGGSTLQRVRIRDQ